MKRLCKRCEGFSVDWPLPHPRRRHQHHGSLAALKSCAESGACALCHLLWVGAKKLLQRVDPGLIPTYLSRWPQDSRLFIVDSKDLRQNVHHPLTLVKGPASSDGREGSKEELLGRFHITAEPGTPASQKTPARILGLKSILGAPSPKSIDPQCVAQIKDWMAQCQSPKHKNCGFKSSNVALPKRLIDVRDPNHLRLVEPGEHARGRYVALSYSWGEKKSSSGNVHDLELKVATRDKMLDRISRSKMTLSHAQAMDLARSLGYDYIWIDALCIMQDRPEDWKAESHNVPGIYGRAELTVMAGRSANSRDGFLDISKWYKPDAPPVEVAFKSAGEPGRPAAQASRCWVSLPRSRDAGPTNSRAWCYQESLLSRRTVVFGQEQLTFTCPSFEQAESGFRSGNTQHHWAKRLKSLAAAAGPPPALHPDYRASIMREWYVVVEGYSWRQMYDRRDAYAAFAGIAAQFRRALASGSRRPQYLAGIWDADMAQGLMWTSARLGRPSGASNLRRWQLRRPRRVRKPEDGDGTLPPLVLAPTWSWLALEGPVTVPQPEAGSVPVCSPGSGAAAAEWAPPGRWGVDKILEEEIRGLLPFALAVRGSLRAVRATGESPAAARLALDKHRHPHMPRPERLAREGVCLMAGEGSGGRVLGVALLDREGHGASSSSSSSSSSLWALAIFGRRVGGGKCRPRSGLLLSRDRSAPTRYTRVGVFWFVDGADSPRNDFAEGETQIVKIV